MLKVLPNERGILALSLAECRDELRSVIESRAFQQSPRQVRLLQYLCSRSVLGESGQVNEHTIGVDVFGKPDDFKVSKDSTVRVEMHRLRRRLSAFYEDEGADHKLRIVISAGNYTPEFQFVPTENHSEGTDLPALSEDFRAPGPQPNGVVYEKKPTGMRNVLPIVTALVILVSLGVAVGVFAWHARTGHDPGRAADPAILLPNEEVHILAGYPGAPWTDGGGRQWLSDRYYEGGDALRGADGLVPAPPERRTYRMMRQGRRAGELPDEGGTFAYNIPMKPGTYELHLYFADPIRQSQLLQEEQDAQNLRHFDVAVNGDSVLRRFDVVTDSGAAAVDVRAFKDIRPAADGRVHLQFSPNPNQPFVNALELVPSKPGHANPVRITPRRSVLTDSEGRKWGPDDYFIGGRLIVHPMPAEANLPELYRAERYGSFAYAIPVPAGVYSLTLYFAEAMFVPSAPSGMCRGSGCRVFDVTCNGVMLVHDLDVFEASGGAFRPLSRTFHGLRPNGQGKLLVSFSPSINYAEVRAIEVLDETP